MDQVYEDNTSTWRRRPDGSWDQFLRPKAPRARGSGSRRDLPWFWMASAGVTAPSSDSGNTMVDDLSTGTLYVNDVGFDVLTDRLRVTTSGWYRLTIVGDCGSSTTGIIRLWALRVYRQDAASHSEQFIVEASASATGGYGMHASTTRMLHLDAGDTLKFWVRQDSGGDRVMNVSLHAVLLDESASSAWVRERKDDTGWLPLDLSGSIFENYGGSWPPAAARRIGETVYLRGLLTLTADPSNTDVIAPLPQGMGAPTGSYLMPGRKRYGGTVRVEVTNGDIRARYLVEDAAIQGSLAGGVNDWICLDGVTYTTAGPAPTYVPPAYGEWVDVPMVNDWVRYSTGWATLQVRRSFDGWVQLRGLIKGGTSSHIATLPYGFRPATTQLMSSIDRDYNHFRFDVGADGRLVLYGTYTTDWVSCFNLMWHTDEAPYRGTLDTGGGGGTSTVEVAPPWHVTIYSTAGILTSHSIYRQWQQEHPRMIDAPREYRTMDWTSDGVTIPADGLYHCWTRIALNDMGDESGRITLGISVNDTMGTAGRLLVRSHQGNSAYYVTDAVLPLKAGDVVSNDFGRFGGNLVDIQNTTLSVTSFSAASSSAPIGSTVEIAPVADQIISTTGNVILDLGSLTPKSASASAYTAQADGIVVPWSGLYSVYMYVQGASVDPGMWSVLMAVGGEARPFTNDWRSTFYRISRSWRGTITEWLDKDDVVTMRFYGPQPDAEGRVASTFTMVAGKIRLSFLGTG